MTIEEFIAARIAEREKGANEAIRLETIWADDDSELQYEWVRFRRSPTGQIVASMFVPGAPAPAEVRRQYAAMRKLVRAELDNLAAWDGELGDGCTREQIRAAQCADRFGDLNQSNVLRALAAIWSDHPDYQQDWKL